MLDDTLVIWTGEFGRTPDNNKRGGVYSLGRGHNAEAMTMLLAGGGVKKGAVVGATDELGLKAVECVHPIRDLHVTLLHLLGLDDNKLTYFHAGRYKQLEPVRRPGDQGADRLTRHPAAPALSRWLVRVARQPADGATAPRRSEANVG